MDQKEIDKGREVLAKREAKNDKAMDGVAQLPPAQRKAKQDKIYGAVDSDIAAGRTLDEAEELLNNSRLGAPKAANKGPKRLARTKATRATKTASARPPYRGGGK